MTRTTVISGLIDKYDAIIVKNRTVSDTELAVFKLAICQLVDAAFSGGGGGGSPSAATIAGGIDDSVDIELILDRLISLDTNNLTQAQVQAAIQAAADIDTLITRLTSIDTKTMVQADITAAIQAATDIDTIITRLTTIATNTGTSSGANIVASYTQGLVSITDAGAAAIAANASRKTAIIINKSTTDRVDLFLGTLGTFGNGLPLAPSQSYEINSTNLYQGVINARTDTAITVSLAVAEGI
jgi:hypothetical protein